MAIKIKLVRDNEPVFFYRESHDQVLEHDRDTSNLVIDPEQLWIKRAIQQLQAEIRNQEIAELRKRYNL
jgi:hypothetical protein